MTESKIVFEANSRGDLAQIAINLVEEIAVKERSMLNNVVELEGHKAEIKRIESQHLEPIAQDKVRYPNEKSRDAAVTVKCASDPFYQMKLSEYNTVNTANSEDRIEINRLNNILTVLTAYLSN